MATNMIPYSRYERALRDWPFADLFEAPFSLAAGSQSSHFDMDVEDADSAYVVTAELPGVSKDQIDVELNEGRLSISVEKKESEESKAKNYLHKETREWSCTRGVYLKDAATAGLSAKLEDGVLTVNVPKQEEKVNVTKVSID